MLDLNIKKYEAEKKFIFFMEMANQLPKLKQQYEWLKTPPSQSLQQTCMNLDRAIQAVWKSKFGFPKFKSKVKSRDSCRIPQSCGQIKVNDQYITVPKLGQVKWKYHRPLTGTLKSITITLDIDRWYVSVLCETPDIDAITEVDKSRTIGIDLGVSNFATLSDGTKIASPNFLKKQLRKLKYQQRFTKNKIKGSNNGKKQYAHIAKIHRKIRNQRSDWLHKLSRDLVKKYDVICVEDLKIKELLEKKQISRSIADQGWGIFVDQLKHKTQSKGKHLTKINTYLPSTKTCSCCGNTKIMKLSDRVYICENSKCSDYLKTKDRDHNAAINIHVWGLMATPSIQLYTPGTGGIKACGDTLTHECQAYDWHHEVSEKQEAADALASR